MSKVCLCGGDIKIMRSFAAGAVSGLVVIGFLATLFGPPQQSAAPSTEPANAPKVTQSDQGPDQLREAVYAGDRDAVKAVLAHVNITTFEEQTRQRQLFSVFSELHPDVIRFVEHWAREEPDSAIALTARGWSLFAQGWTFRGDKLARDVHPHAMTAFVAAHEEGLRLMQKAAALDPRLLAASDGILRMAYTIGHRDLIPAEMARIMAIAPNRFSLTLAGQAYAPNWGGSLEEMSLLCRQHAAKVVDWPGYDEKVCLADGIMQSGIMTFAEMRKVTGVGDNPLIKTWLPAGDDIPRDNPSETLAYLDKIKAERPLGYMEANIYDQMIPLVASVTGETRPLEFPGAVERQAENARRFADRNPGDWRAARRLLNALMESKDINQTDFDRTEFRARAITSLEINPFNPNAWAYLGTEYLVGEQNEEAGVRAAEPYFINAAVYSSYRPEDLKMLGGVKLGLFFRNRANNVVPSSPKTWQSDIVCPMVRQLRLLQAVCQAEGQAFPECSGLGLEETALRAQIDEITGLGMCEIEATESVENLIYEPIQITFQKD